MRVNALAVSPDESKLAMGVELIQTTDVGSTHLINQLWVWNQDEQEISFKAPTESLVTAIEFYDNNTLITNGGGFDLLIWEIQIGQITRRLTGNLSGISGIDLSPDGKYIITSSWGGDITNSYVRYQPGDVRIWDYASGTHEIVFREERLISFTDVSFTSDGEYILANAGTEVYVWQTNTRTAMPTIPQLPMNVVKDIDISPISNTFVLAGDQAFIYDIESNQSVGSFIGHPAEVTNAEFSLDGTNLITASGNPSPQFAEELDDSSIRIWEISSGRLIREYRGHQRGIRAITLMNNSEQIISSDYDGVIKIWHLRLSDSIHSICSHLFIQGFTEDEQNWYGVDPLDNVCPPSNREAATSNLIPAPLDIPEAQYDGLAERRKVQNHTSAITSVAISSDGKLILSISDDHGILWDRETGDRLQDFNFDEGGTRHLDFSPDGSKFVRQTFSGELQLFSTQTQELEFTYDVTATAPYPTSTGFIFASDGQELVVANSNGVTIFETSTGAVRDSFESRGSIDTIALSPNGELIAGGGCAEETRLGCTAGQIMVWKMETGEIVFSQQMESAVQGISTNITNLGFINNDQLVSISFYGAMRTWQITENMLLRTSARVFGVNTTFTSDVTLLLIYGDGLTIWNMQTEQDIATLIPYDTITSVEASKDGTFAVAGGQSSSLYLIDLSTRTVTESALDANPDMLRQESAVLSPSAATNIDEGDTQAEPEFQEVTPILESGQLVLLSNVDAPEVWVRELPGIHETSWTVIPSDSVGLILSTETRNIDDRIWYQIEVVPSGITGWVEDELIFDANSNRDLAEIYEASCPGAGGFHFEIGQRFIVPYGDGPANVYTEPNSQPQVGTIYEGEGGTIEEGPICVEGRRGNLLSWYVRTDSGIQGWVSEGYSDDIFPWIIPSAMSP
ncbi:MAG: hypothetical protein KJ065_07100 [Anaerolineae bacterium]|nr:hypothetical protein [Anaerolineae bacterium]